ncbi:MAG: GNAT family N-acetyltransferase [Propionibacteriaceae bacterium]|nr:GNAT family N-acetyltransferase [Propionibacteriaceae bacterium]
MATITALLDDDIPEVAQFLTECWQQVYIDILDADVLATITPEYRSAYLRQHMHDGATGLLARNDAQELVGMSFYEPSHSPILIDACLIDKLYVQPHLIGTGLGHTLLVATENAVIGRGYTTAGLDVYPTNLRAISFYQSHGYKQVGTAVDHLAGHEYPLDVMAKDLAKS